MARDYSKLTAELDRHLDAAGGDARAIDWRALIQMVIQIILSLFKAPAASKAKECPSQECWDALAAEADRGLRASCEGVCSAVCLRQKLDECKPGN